MILFTLFQCRVQSMHQKYTKFDDTDTKCRLLSFMKQVQVTHCTGPVHKANWYTEYMSRLQSILQVTQYTHEANADYKVYCRLHSIHMKHMQCTQYTEHTRCSVLYHTGCACHVWLGRWQGELGAPINNATLICIAPLDKQISNINPTTNLVTFVLHISPSQNCTSILMYTNTRFMQHPAANHIFVFRKSYSNQHHQLYVVPTESTQNQHEYTAPKQPVDMNNRLKLIKPVLI